MGSNKWVRAAIPALLLHCSIGTVYCWSVFSQEIADYVEWSKPTVEWAFSLAIFFLGMSAAFLGNIVEKDIHKSSLIATICFAAGMAGTGFFIWYGGNHKGSLLRRSSQAQSRGTYRNILKLRFRHGNRTRNRLSVTGQDTYALVQGP